jgi:hypothetical protein
VRAAYGRLVEAEGVDSPDVYTMSRRYAGRCGRGCAERVCGM